MFREIEGGHTQGLSQSSFQYNLSKRCGNRPSPFWSIYRRYIPIRRPTELCRRLERNRGDELNHRGGSCELGNRRLPERAHRVRIQSPLSHDFPSVTLTLQKGFRDLDVLEGGLGLSLHKMKVYGRLKHQCVQQKPPSYVSQ